VPAIFTYHRITAEPRQWRTLATSLAQHSGARLAEQGGRLYGLWRSQIGRPRDELQAMTVWSGAIRAREAERLLLGVEPEVHSVASEMLLSTLRPADATPPTRQGNFAFRWFATPAEHWPEFLDLCTQA